MANSKINVKDYRSKDTAALKKELAGIQRELFDLRTKGAVEKLDDTSALKKAKRNIARLKTLLREQELAQK